MLRQIFGLLNPGNIFNDSQTDRQTGPQGSFNDSLSDGPGAGSSSPASPQPTTSAGETEPEESWLGKKEPKNFSAAMAKLIDVTKCTGCRGCQVACKQWNQLPAQVENYKGSYQTHLDTLGLTYTIVKFIEPQKNENPAWLFRKHQCMHCGKAVCVERCPHFALSYTEVGSVIRDYGKCRSCGTCIAVCPYGIPKRDYTLPRKNPRQCVFCYDRVVNGLSPACVKSCPANALAFGTLEEIQAQAQERVEDAKKRFPKARVYNGSDLKIGPNSVIYVLGDSPDKYGLVPKSAMRW